MHLAFKEESRKAFRSAINLDTGTWARGRAWTLWKALICAANLTNSNAVEATQALSIIDDCTTKTTKPYAKISINCKGYKLIAAYKMK